MGHTDNPESQLTTQWLNDLRNVCRVEAGGGQFKCCITIEQKKSDIKGLQDSVGNHYVKWWWCVLRGVGG